jgi:hypothetical protein
MRKSEREVTRKAFRETNALGKLANGKPKNYSRAEIKRRTALLKKARAKLWKKTRLAHHTRADRTAAHRKSDQHRAYLCAVRLRKRM